MRLDRLRLVLSCVLLLAAAESSFAQPGVTYPKVYGPTGSLYGPTQAHYQYQRQYGRAWVSPTGRSTPLNPNGTPGGYTYAAPSYFPQVPVVPYRYSPFVGGFRSVHVRTPVLNLGVNVGVGRGALLNVPGIVGFQSGYPYGSGITAIQSYPIGGYPAYPYATAPLVTPYAYNSLLTTPRPLDNAVMARARLEEQQRWQQPLAVQPVVGREKPLTRKSTKEMILRSVTHRTNGDEWFRKLRYSIAYDRYQSAIRAAGDLPDNHLRAGFALVAMGKPALAASFFERAVELAPTLPTTGIPLAELFGDENGLARTSMILKTSAWVREDIRDPERLFVLGVLLHFDGQRDKAAEFFETAHRLQGGGDHLVAFLAPPVVEPVEVRQPVQPKVIEIPMEPENAPAGPVLPFPEP